MSNLKNGSPVQKKEIEQIIESVKAPINHPLFYPRIFALAAREGRKTREAQHDPLFQSVLEEYEELSRRLDRSQIQESTSVRNVLRTRQLAQLLVNEKGEINHSLLPTLITYYEAHLYSLGPNRQYDACRQEHILKALKLLLTQKELTRLLKMFTRPITHQWAEELIRQTLQLSPGVSITDAHTIQAVLCSWLCYLRQNVGSCFATAPAEIIHDEQPELFLRDLLDLIATGMLKRTYGGIENSIPLSASWGSGDLKKPLVLQISSKGMMPEIWYSPGLMAAFEASGLLKSERPVKDKVRQIEEWIKGMIQERGAASQCILTAEEIIRTVLLHSLTITHQQVKEYESRHPGMIQKDLFVPIAIARNPARNDQKCAHFLSIFQAAKNAFKAMSDNALLKAWEFTLASFSDIKYEFARWNLYASLGLQTNEPGGIGQSIYQIIQKKLEIANQQVQDIQYEYESVYTQVKTIEARMRSASTEKEVEWLKIDYQSRLNEFDFLEEQRNVAHHRASCLVNLYDTLYKQYVNLFKDYFQEIYDADMQEVVTGPFDDTPAGFRLVYKHGRSNSSLWTRIKNEQEYVDALTSFFIATEPHIAHELEEENIAHDLSDVVTSIIHHIKTKEFLQSAFHRMAIAHQAPLIKNPLEHMEYVEKKPWVYTSGGTMNTLVSCYYRIDEKPKEVEKWVESEMELLVYLADTLKAIPGQLLDPFLKGKRHAILMQSPTHAFLMKPMLAPFKEAWMHEEFTYTYIRDRLVRPIESFVERILLNRDMIHYLLDKMCEKIPENFKPRFISIFGKMDGSWNSILFRQYLVETIEHEKGLGQRNQSILSKDEIDALLYASLPLFSIHELRDRVEKIVSFLPMLQASDMSRIMELFDLLPLSTESFSVVGAQQLQEICKALVCFSSLSTTTPYDPHLHISLAAQTLGFAMPSPLLFADTNWVKEMLGFTVNPGTGAFELWRFDYTGSIGYPMTSWKQWVNGSRSDLRWGIYVKPYEYGQN